MAPDHTQLDEIADRDDVPDVIEALQTITDEDAQTHRETIVTLLDHRSVAVREAAAAAAGEHLIDEARDKLIAMAHKTNENNRHVRQKVVKALASFQRPEVEDALEMAQSDPSLNVREEAKESLRRLRGA